METFTHAGFVQLGFIRVCVHGYPIPHGRIQRVGAGGSDTPPPWKITSGDRFP